MAGFVYTPNEFLGVIPPSDSRFGVQNIVAKFFITPTGPEFAWSKSLYANNSLIIGSLATGPGSETYLVGEAWAPIFDGNRFWSTGVSGDRDAFIAKIGPDAGIPTVYVDTTPQQVFVGAAISLGATVSATTAVSYQWFKNGVIVAGATNRVFTIEHAAPGDEGFYYVQASNAAGTARSAAIQVFVSESAPVLVTTVAGTGSPGFLDAVDGKTAQFKGPSGLAVDPDGFVLAADAGNNVVRVIDPTGAVGTFVGTGAPGFGNGPASLATFRGPANVFSALSRDVYVVDTGNEAVRRVGSFGTRSVSTVAGTGAAGFANGLGLQSTFDGPYGLAVTAGGDVFVCDANNHAVRKFAADTGRVSTFAGGNGEGFLDGPKAGAKFSKPAGLALDAAGNLWVADQGNHRLRKIATDGTVSTAAGNGTAGFVDGPASQAALNLPSGVTVDPYGYVYWTELGNHAVRRLSPSGVVLTMAGLGPDGAGFKDGDKMTGRFRSPSGIVRHPDGSLWVADTGNHAIRKVEWQVTEGPEVPEIFVELNPKITVYGKVGATYRIEATEDTGSLPVAWLSVGSLSLTNRIGSWTDTQPAWRPYRMYRAVRVE